MEVWSKMTETSSTRQRNETGSMRTHIPQQRRTAGAARMTGHIMRLRTRSGVERNRTETGDHFPKGQGQTSGGRRR